MKRKIKDPLFPAEKELLKNDASNKWDIWADNMERGSEVDFQKSFAPKRHLNCPE
jgi:hypothetical protein